MTPPPEYDEDMRRNAVEAEELILKKAYGLARENPAIFASVVLRDEQTNRPVKLAPMHHAWHQLITDSKRLVLLAHIESAKALSIETPIATPTGWTTMGALREGDTVFDSKGHQCTVTMVTQVQYGRTVYRILFDDHSAIFADADHLWLTQTLDDMHKHNEARYRAKHGIRSGVRQNKIDKTRDGFRIVTTQQMLDAGLFRVTGAKRKDGTKYDQYVWRMPLPGIIQYPLRELPVHPYVLGVWLGNGSRGTSDITFCEDDIAYAERCAELAGGRRAYRPDKDSRAVTVCIGPPSSVRSNDGLRAKIKELGILYEKSIPLVYLTAGEDQRRELLAGLLDTDGTISETGKICFTSCTPQLAQDTLELIRSLGIKASMKESDAKLNGRVVGRQWRINFTPDVQVFWLNRKLSRQKLQKKFGRASYRSVVAIEPVESMPVKCITVDSHDRSYLAGREYLVTHNTQGLSVGRTLYEIGRNRNIRVLLLSNTFAQACKIMRSISQYLLHSEELRKVWPDLKASDPWTQTSVTVERTTFSKDPTVYACGVHGSILGARLDLVIADDLLDYENTRTPEQREQLFHWFQSTVVSRLTKDARVIMVGTPFSPDDILHRLARQWPAYRYPVIDDHTGEPRWPERWPLDRIAERRRELGPLEAARQLDCRAYDEATARFKREWIDVCLNRGREKELPFHVNIMPHGCKTYTGVDLAVQQHSAADFTCFFTIMVYPNGDRQVLNIETGRWAGPDIISKMLDINRRYMSIMVVENVGSQDFILQFARNISDMPIIPFTTGRQKAHPEFGVEALATELAAGKWIIPSVGGLPANKEIDAWIAELLQYTPDAHTGDRVMANYFAREGARRGQQKLEFGRIDLLTR